MLEEKIEVIRKYLLVEFPDHNIEDQYDFDLDAQIFRISKVDNLYFLRVTQEFINDNSPSSIDLILRRRNVANFIRQAEGHTALLKNKGTEIISD